MPAYLELRIDPAEEVHALCLDIDFAFVPGAVEAAELRGRDELFGGLLRKVWVAARNVHSADAELSNLPVGQWAELIDLEDDIGDVGKRRADGDGLSWTQTLATRVGACLSWAVGVDNLTSAPGPWLHERAGEGLPGRHNITA